MQTSIENDVLLTESEAAAKLLALPQTLRAWRCRNRGPAFLKLTGQIRYRLSDIEAFIAASRVDPAEKARRGSAHGTRRGSR